MKRVLTLLLVLVWTTSGLATGIVDNGNAVGEDSLSIPIYSLDSIGTPQAIAAGDSVYIVVFYAAGSEAFRDSMAGNDASITTSAWEDFAGVGFSNYKESVANLDGTATEGVYSYVVVVDDVSLGLETLITGSFQLYDTRTLSEVLDFLTTTNLISSDNIGINWADVSNPTTTVNLTQTTIDSVREVGVKDTNAVDLSNYDGATPLVVGDNIGINWGDITNPTTAQNLSATNIDVDQIVASVSGNVDGSVASVVADVTLADGEFAIIADSLWQADTAGHNAVAGSFGEFLYKPQSASLTDADMAAIADSVWQADTAGHNNIAASFGEHLYDFNATISDADMAAIADSVWNEDSTGHYTTPQMAFVASQTSAAGPPTWSDAQRDSVLRNMEDGAITATKLASSAANEISDTTWDEVLTGATHNIASSAGRRLRQLETGQVLLTGTINTANDSTATLGLSGNYPDGFFNHNWLVVTVNPDSVQIRQINVYTGATDSVSMAAAESWVVVPANGDAWEIIANTGVHVVDLHAPVLDQIWEADTSTMSTAQGIGTILKDASDLTITYIDADIDANMIQISGDATAADNFETMLDGTGGKPFTLSQLVMRASDDDTAFIAMGSGSGIGGLFKGGASNAHGISFVGVGAGSGILGSGGNTGHGMNLLGGATSGTGLYVRGSGTGDGAYFQGGATNGDGLELAAQGTGLDLNAPLFIDGIWDEDTTGHKTDPQMGYWITQGGTANISDADMAAIADSVWQALLEGHDDIAGSFADSAQAWGATGAGGDGNRLCSTLVVNADGALSSGAVRMTSGGDSYTALISGDGFAVFNLNDATWLGLAYVTGNTQDTIPQTFVITAAVRDTITMSAQSVTGASDPDMCNAYLWVFDIVGDTVENVKLTAEINGNGPWFATDDSAAIIIPKKISATSADSGYVFIPLWRSSEVIDEAGNNPTYNFTLEKSRHFKWKVEDKTVPDTALYNIK